MASSAPVNGCARAAARTRAKSPVGYCRARKRLTEHFEAGTVKRIRARAPHACSELDKVYRVNAIGELKNVQAVLQRISTRHALPPSRRTRPASKRQRSIRVSARTWDSGVVWGMYLPQSHPRPCHRAV